MAINFMRLSYETWIKLRFSGGAQSFKRFIINLTIALQIVFHSQGSISTNWWFDEILSDLTELHKAFEQACRWNTK